MTVDTNTSATVFCGILHRLGFSRGYIRGCLVFFLFHWELLVWSSLLNLKDTLVMTLTIQFLVYPENWPEHLMWASILAYVLSRGPGALSIDRFVALRLFARA